MNEGYDNPTKTWCANCEWWDGGEECLHPRNLWPDKYGIPKPIDKAEDLNRNNLCTMYESVPFACWEG